MSEQSGAPRRFAKVGWWRELLFGVLFGMAGGFLGGLAGNLPAAIAGVVIGAALGVVAGWSLQATAVSNAQHERSLDRDIGVVGGNVGVSCLEHPPPRVGAPSKAASGVSGSVEPREASGPILRPPD